MYIHIKYQHTKKKFLFYYKSIIFKNCLLNTLQLNTLLE